MSARDSSRGSFDIDPRRVTASIDLGGTNGGSGHARLEAELRLRGDGHGGLYLSMREGQKSITLPLNYRAYDELKAILAAADHLIAERCESGKLAAIV